MLNLNELSDRSDRQLQSETPESLTSWLAEQRLAGCRTRDEGAGVGFVTEVIDMKGRGIGFWMNSTGLDGRGNTIKRWGAPAKGNGKSQTGWGHFPNISKSYLT
jgi:hypothetical protein